MTEIRVAEVMAALSLTTDLATGVPFEKGLRVCLVADEFLRRTGADESMRRTVFQTTLLRSIGCTAHAPENAAEFVDDTAFQHALKQLDPGDPDVLGAQLARFGDWAGEPGSMAGRFAEIAPSVGPYAAGAGCEVSRTLAPGLGACAEAVDALDDVYERWDGRGIPRGRRAEQLSAAGRVLHLAEQAVLAQAVGGDVAAIAEVGRRAGGHLDPEMCAAFADHAHALLQVTASSDLLGEVLAREPEPRRRIEATELPDLCAVLGDVADLKSSHLVGHSARLARLVAAAATRVGLPAAEIQRLRAAAYLHHLGSAVVPSSLLDRSPSAPLGAADRERLRLQTYWTGRILQRCPSLHDLDPVVRPAGALHVAFAEQDWRTWSRSADLQPVGELPFGTRLLEAAEAWATLTEDRPGRVALSADHASGELQAAVADGRLDADAVAAVLPGGTRPGPRPVSISSRELEVLRLAARGLSNKEIGAALVISERTVGHHLAHVYDKTGYRTRAGVAVWAAHQGLLPGGPE